MDHLEHLSGSINGQQDALSKGVHRSSMQAGENGSIHFVEMTHNGREQEYIESSLLGTDLLSSQLPTNLLNDYINSVSTAGTNSMSGIQSTIIEHNYRSFNTDELHALDNESNNEATDMINGNKDIPGFNTLSSYEKIINGSPSTSQINANGLAQIAGIDGYVHFPLSSTLHANGGSANDGFDMVSSVGLVASESHSHQEQLQQLQYNLSHHQHSGPGHLNHHQNIVELTNTGSQQLALIQHQLQQQPHQRHSHHSLIEEQSKASINITIPTLSPVDVPMKLYAHSNSIIPSTSSASGQNDIYNSPKLSMASLKSNKSEKRFYSCTTLPSLITHSQQRISFPAVESLITSKNSRTSTIDCESRLHEQVIAECVASIESASGFLGNINLPHKKRLAKKIGNARECTSNGNPDMDQTSILAFDQCSQRHASISTSIQLPTAMSTRQQLSIQRNNKALHSNESANSSLKINQPSATISQPSSDPFCCRVCGEIIQDQLLFFKHLKHHYEPSATDKNTAAVVNIVTIKAATNEIPLDTADGKKAKPKLPRVKHTKKLKNDRTVRHNELDEKNQHTKGDSKAVDSLKPPDTSSKDVNNILLPSNAVIGLECSENGGEFSETEDMLEGIRNVVQKVQETVDTDMNEELILANNTSWRFPAVLDSSDIQTSGNTTTTLTEKEMPLVGDGLEDTSEIHIQNGGENYLLFLSKSQFNDTEMLHSTAHDLPLIGKPLEKLTHTLNDNNVNEQASDEQEIVQIQNPHLPGSGEVYSNVSSTFPLLSGAGTVSEISPAFHSPANLPISSIIELPSNSPHKLSVATYDPTHRNSMSDLRKAKLLKDEQKTDDEDDDERKDFEEPECDQMQYESIDTTVHDEPLKDSVSSNHEKEKQNLDEEKLDEKCDGTKTRKNARSEKRKLVSQSPTVGTDPGEVLAEKCTSRSSQKFLCKEKDCGRKFKSNTAFAYHQLQHSGERPYKCKSCEKCFLTCSALKVHERLHSGEKPYKCDECGNNFRQWGDLKYHQISIHSNEKSHKCEYCGKEFARRYSLVLHRRIHTNEKNFICDFCNKAFRASSYLHAHRMIHTGEKPHQCSKCDKKFRCHGDLNRHLKTHTRTSNLRTVPNNDAQANKSDVLQIGTITIEKLKINDVKKAAKQKCRNILKKNNNSIVIA